MKKLGLTLGGGGARGAAHIGVLMELEKKRIRPHLVTGTSIGGIVGALYAAGLETVQLLSFFKQMNVNTLFSITANRPSLSSNNKLEKLLESILGRITFADLKIPLALICTDLVTRQEVVLDEGDLISAILATAALPVVLPPVERDEQILVDGGLLNNVPFDIARARGATSVLAVDVMHSAPYGTTVEAPPAAGVVELMLNITQRRQTWQVISSTLDIITMQSMNTRLALSKPDLLLRPYIGNIGLFDFHRWKEGIEAGEKTAQSHMQEILALHEGVKTASERK